MEKVLINKPQEYEAQEGDKFELHFNILSLPFIDKFQQRLIAAKISENPLFKVIDTKSEGGQFVVTVVIVKNPFPLALAIGAVATVCAGFFIWSSLNKVYKIVETPAGAVLSIGGIAGAIAAVVGLIIILKGR